MRKVKVEKTFPFHDEVGEIITIYFNDGITESLKQGWCLGEQTFNLMVEEGWLSWVKEEKTLVDKIDTELLNTRKSIIVAKIATDYFKDNPLPGWVSGKKVLDVFEKTKEGFDQKEPLYKLMDRLYFELEELCEEKS